MHGYVYKGNVRMGMGYVYIWSCVCGNQQSGTVT